MGQATHSARSNRLRLLARRRPKTMYWSIVAASPPRLTSKTSLSGGRPPKPSSCGEPCQKNKGITSHRGGCLVIPLPCIAVPPSPPRSLVPRAPLSDTRQGDKETRRFPPSSKEE